MASLDKKCVGGIFRCVGGCVGGFCNRFQKPVLSCPHKS